MISLLFETLFCVEIVCCIPDFGLCEGGRKYNNDKTEQHSSSVGLERRAVGVIGGFNISCNQDFLVNYIC